MKARSRDAANEKSRFQNALAFYGYIHTLYHTSDYCFFSGKLKQAGLATMFRFIYYPLTRPLPQPPFQIKIAQEKEFVKSLVLLVMNLYGKNEQQQQMTWKYEWNEMGSR